MTDADFRLFCSVMHLDTPAKLRTVENAAAVAHQYLAPFIAKAGVDMLGDLYGMVAENPRARVIYLGRDGYSFGNVIRQLDPVFHNRYSAELHIPRVLADSVLEEAQPWSVPGADGFRKPGPHRDQPSPGWSDLVEYAEDSNLYLDRADAEFALVDTGFKGSVQEMLTAAYPDTRFHGHYLFFCASDTDRNADRKQGYALHLGQPNPLNGRAIRDRFVDDPALTFAHHDAIVAVEDLTRGVDVPINALAQQTPALAGINPARVASRYSDPYVRQAVLAAISTTVATSAIEIRQARADSPDMWYATLTDRAAVLRPQIHEWLAGRPADPALAELLDSFVRRADNGTVPRQAARVQAALSRSTTVTSRTPPPSRAPEPKPSTNPTTGHPRHRSR